MAANRFRGIATSAIWKNTCRECDTTFAPILISFSHSVVSDQCLTERGSASEILADVNDAERLRLDPVMRHVVGGRAVDRDAASMSQVARFETDVLCHPDNLDVLMAMPGQWVDRIRRRRLTGKLILDMDSSVSPTYGQQEGTAYNDFECECYHPLFLFNQDGDLERALLRCRNVASADDWQAVLEPVIERYRRVDIPRFFRGNAAFAIWQLYEVLEAQGY